MQRLRAARIVTDDPLDLSDLERLWPPVPVELRGVDLFWQYPISGLPDDPTWQPDWDTPDADA